MKILKLATIALMISLAFIACKKSDDKPFVIEGTWEGKLGPSFIGLNIKPGGTLERVSSNGEVSATGNWQFQENTFTGKYTFLSGTIVNISGTVSKSSNTISGTWKNSGNEQGTWNVSKK
jgi:hypothetical protein